MDNIDMIPGHLFTWANNTGTSEFSSLPVELGTAFIMRGKNRAVAFRRVAESRNNEGELEFVDYRSACDKFNVRVFND